MTWPATLKTSPSPSARGAPSTAIDLDLQLRRHGVTQIVLAWLTTSIGVESTARAAYQHGYHVTLAIDAMADLDPEAHRNSVERIFPLLGQTGSTTAIVEMLAKARS